MAGRRGMRTTAILLALGAMALGATQAQGRAKIDTVLAEHSVDCGWAPPDCLYFGQLDSPEEKCIRGRKVQIFRILMGGERQLIDTDKTSRRGNFAGIGPSSEVSAFKLKVLPKQVGDDKCKGTSYTGV